jgi:hypothetical protein
MQLQLYTHFFGTYLLKATSIATIIIGIINFSFFTHQIPNVINLKLAPFIKWFTEIL